MHNCKNFINNEIKIGQKQLNLILVLEVDYFCLKGKFVVSKSNFWSNNTGNI